jgi:hypothetical protein
MRSSILVLAASGSLVQGNWLRWSLTQGRDLSGLAYIPPKETGSVASQTESSSGWTPMPTPAPGLMSAAERVLNILLGRSDETLEKRANTTNSWENDHTCGWVSGISCEYKATRHLGIVLSSNEEPYLSRCLDVRDGIHLRD